MSGQRQGGLAGRQRHLLILAGLPALVLSLLLAGWSFRAGREEVLLALVERAADQQRAVDALLGGTSGREAGEEEQPGDAASRLDRARELVAGLTWPVGPVRLVEAEAAPAEEPGRVLARPVGDGRLWLEHRIDPGALRAAGLAAALPWLVLAALLLATLVGAHLLLRFRLVAPIEAALDGLVELARGLPARTLDGPGWLAPWLEAAAAGARRQARRLAEAEAAEAPLLAALEGVAQGVALLDPEGRLELANRAFGEALSAAGLAPPRPGAPLEPAIRAALLGPLGARQLALGSGGRLLLLPPGPAAEPPASGRPPAGASTGPRLASMVQEVAEAASLVARQAVLLHELAGDEATRRRALQLRAAAERCTRAIAPFLGPPRPLPPRAVAVDRLVEDRLGCLERAGIALSIGLAPALPPVGGDPDRVADLLDGALAALLPAGGPPPRPIALRIRLRRSGPRLRLDLERPGPHPGPPWGGLLSVEDRARESGVALASEPAEGGGTAIRLEWPLDRALAGASAPGRLLAVAGERGAA